MNFKEEFNGLVEDAVQTTFEIALATSGSFNDRRDEIATLGALLHSKVSPEIYAIYEKIALAESYLADHLAKRSYLQGMKAGMEMASMLDGGGIDE